MFFETTVLCMIKNANFLVNVERIGYDEISGTPSNRLWSNDYQRNGSSCDCNFDEFNSSNCWKHGISKSYKQANVPRKEKTLTTKIIHNLFNRFPSSFNHNNKSVSPKKMQLISSQNIFSSSSNFSSSKKNNNKSSTKKDQPTTTTSTSTSSFSVMKIKIFRRSISPKPLQEVTSTTVSGGGLLNVPSSSSTPTIATTTTMISGGSKKKVKGRRTSRNPALCPFSPPVSVSGSEDDEPKPESSNAFFRVARELCSRFTSSTESSSQPSSSSSTVATTTAVTRRSTTTTTTTTNEAAIINTFTEILSNPSLGSPSERAEIACNVIHSTVEYTNILVPDMISITAATYYWGMMDRYEAERLLEGKPEGTFLLRDSAQINYLFSVSFRRYQRTLHARIEHINGIYSFDIHDDAYHRAEKIKDLVENYRDPKQCLFYEPQLSLPLKRDFAFDLKHLCRAVITAHTTYENVSTLPLPPPLKKYLREYHFKQPIRVTDHDV